MTSFLKKITSFFTSPNGVSSGVWVATNRGIKRWDNEPQLGEIVIWSGSSDVEGYATGKGILQFIRNEQAIITYEGEMLKGRCHGKGIFKFANGACYTGDLMDGNFHGKGVYKFADGGFYEGEFIEDEFNGYGTLYHSDGRVAKQGLWEKDEFIGHNDRRIKVVKGGNKK